MTKKFLDCFNYFWVIRRDLLRLKVVVFGLFKLLLGLENITHTDVGINVFIVQFNCSLIMLKCSLIFFQIIVSTC